MSFDLILTPLGDYERLEDVPEDYAASPIGTALDVSERIARCMPGAAFETERYGVWDGDDGSVEISLGDSDLVTSLHMSLRGEIDAVMPRVLDLASALGCRIIDCQTSEFFGPDTGRESISAWSRFRDRVLRRNT